MEHRYPGTSCSEQGRQIVSRHWTSEGMVVYSRCECGTLHMWLVPYDPTVKGLTTDTAA